MPKTRLSLRSRMGRKRNRGTNVIVISVSSMRYQSESEEKSKCKLAYHIDYGFVLGTIPLWVAKEIGVRYDPLYQTGRLHSQCRKFRTGDEPF